MVFRYIKNEKDEYVCNHCEFTAKNQSTMHYHLKKHDGSLHPCKYCNARFLQKSLLDMHIRSRHSETIQKKESTQVFSCPCKECSYEDIRKGNRLIHFVRVHLKDLVDALKRKTTTEDRVIDCNSCNNSFKSMTQFYYHASKCVKPSCDHKYYEQWKLINS